MDNIFNFIKRHNKIFLLPLLVSFATLYLIYEIGIMAQGGFLNVLIAIIGASVISLLAGSAILAIILNNKKAQHFIAASFVTYFVIRAVVSLASENIAAFAQVDDGLFIAQAIFQALGALTLLAVVLFYLGGLFINKFDKLGKYLPYVFLGFIVFELISYILLCVIYSRMEVSWHSYVGISATMLLLPLICFVSYLLIKDDQVYGEN